MSEPRDMDTSRRDVPDADQIAHFRFPVTWNSLVNTRVLAPSVPSLTAEAPHAAHDSTVRWSMVVPKMPHPAPALALPAAGLGETAAFAPPRYVAPKFEVSLDSATLAVKVILLAAVAMLVVPGWRDTGSPGARAIEIESAMCSTNWVRGPSADVALYRPSLDQADYRIEFNWNINPRGVASVFRVTDAGYYGVRIKPISARSLAVEHFVKYRGAERSRVLKTAAVARQDVAVRLDALGPAFRVSIDGKTVVQWTDNRLAAGGVGFLDGANNRPDVQGLRIAFP